MKSAPLREACICFFEVLIKIETILAEEEMDRVFVPDPKEVAQ
jgi:hypothetical protein